MDSHLKTFWLGVCMMLTCACASANVLPQDPLELRCWLQHTSARTKEYSRDSRSVNFSALRDGFTVYSPFQVDFSIRGMGVAPAGQVIQGTGHHHLLVNTALPMDVSQKIPFNDNHRHFGKGQTGGLVSLPPGKHKLRLLFADHDHRPYYVYSQEITINVKAMRAQMPDLRIDPSRFEQTCALWYQNAVTTPRAPGNLLYVKNMRDDEPVQSPFVMKFGVDNFGVCSSDSKAANSGYFVLDVLRAGAVVQRVELKNYTSRLRFIAPEGKELLPPMEQRLRVVDAQKV
jgi:hypothetical protein